MKPLMNREGAKKAEDARREIVSVQEKGIIPPLALFATFASSRLITFPDGRLAIVGLIRQSKFGHRQSQR
jgi:hypothetical protein